MRLPLLIAVGILNSGKTFPVAFEWCPSEDKESFAFFWECLKIHCFERPGEPKTMPMKVVLGDQAAGLTASIPEHLPQVAQQFCNWHACQSIIKRLRQKDIGMKKEDFDDITDATGHTTLGLRKRIWAYLQSGDQVILDKARDSLVQSTRSPIFLKYINEEWQPKEHKVIEAYIKTQPNLGCAASSRGESYHNVIRRITNAQLNLQDAAKRLADTVNSLIKDIDLDEAQSMRSYPRIAQTDVFKSLYMKVSRWAIELLEKEWRELNTIMNNGELLSESCECEILLRYGIACRHYLLQAFLDGTTIPKTLLHPRWWLAGPPITTPNWKPFYPYQGPQQQLFSVPHMATELAILRQQLATEERHRFDVQLEVGERQINDIMTNLVRVGQQHRELQELPIGLPDPNPRSTFYKRSVHGRANQRGLIANEILDRRERQERQQVGDNLQLIPAPQMMTTFQRSDQVPTIPRELNSTPPPQTPPSSAQLPIRTPTTAERPRPRRSPSPEASPAYMPPPSTAPAQLGRGKRQRQKTSKYAEAQQRGEIQESQERLRRAAAAEQEEDDNLYGP
jgi:hypothetical protein